jgi:hypothetical protein
MQSYQARSSSLATPAEKREELSAMKEAVATFQEMRSQKIFIKKRNRVIQNTWRDGILGVEMPGDQGSYFYTPAILQEEQKQAQRLAQRNECKGALYYEFNRHEVKGGAEQLDGLLSER